MLTFLVLTAVALGFAGLGVLAIPLLVLGGLLWLLLLPLKLFGFLLGGLFRLVFGAIGALLGLLAIPVLVVGAGLALLGAFVAALLALLTPLVPVVLLLLVGWAVYRLVLRPSPAL